jgi:YbgC/YbaW family acyl-CoA thioester hydrolase
MSDNPATSAGGATRRHRVRERVRWSDVDVSGIICWSAYTRLVEIAETELFRALGYPYATLWEQLDIWLPRVQAHFDYRNPALLDELLDIDVWVGRIGRSSIRLEFLMRKPNGEVASEAYVVIVAIGRKDSRSVEVPQALLDAMAPYRADLAA